MRSSKSDRSNAIKQRGQRLVSGFPASIDRILDDCSRSREQYESFEIVCRVLRPEGKAYLCRQSTAYRKAVLDLQRVILPAIRRICPVCPHGTCCRLQSSDLSIYIARSVGGFELVDFLLARHGKKLPAPDYAKNHENLCAFWDRGCRLPPASRSLLCLQYFCESLRRELDMNLVELRLEAVRAVVDGFSLAKLLK